MYNNDEFENNKNCLKKKGAKVPLQPECALAGDTLCVEGLDMPIS